ncbi:MAG: PLP-dependent aminotransferase family protein, partial [Alphaproteobacteria bacterium]|nr:PLP-dependent aminotransferase family protein [Alphaproteobacteria bacterium]
MTEPFDFEALFAADLPDGAPPWTGFAEYNFIGGHNDPDGIPVEGLIASAERVLRRRGRSLATYNLDDGPQGDGELRQFLADKLKRYRGVEASADEILITSGSNQALDLINRVMLDKGDTVIAEQFSYAGMINRLRLCGVDVVGVELDRDSLRIDRLAEVLEALADKGVTPKFIYTIPTVQNPTGTVLPLERRRELLDLSRAQGVPVIEDECYADLLWDEEWPISMRGMEGSEHVLHVGSFSKYLSPALRLGYVLAPPAVLSRLVAVKNDGGTGALTQMIVADFLAGNYDAHVAGLNDRLRRKRDAIVAALEEHFGTAAEFTAPPGGIFIWVKLPPEVDTMKLNDAALAAGVAFNPGPVWATDAEPAKNYLRLCFANPSEEQIAAGVAKLAEVCHRETGVPAQSANVSR